MSSQHLSDEAVAAFADGVLRGHARERATRHVEGCAECRHAVRVQREAAWALRTALTPGLPTDLMARLRSVPHTTALTDPHLGPRAAPLPTVLTTDGSTMMATFVPVAALVAPGRPQRSAPHPQSAHPQSAHPQSAHPQSAHPKSAHPQPAHPHPARAFSRPKPYIATAAAVALAGSLVAGSVGHAAPQTGTGSPGRSTTVRQAPAIAPVDTVFVRAHH